MDRDAQVIERFEANLKGVGRLRVASAESSPASNVDLWPASLDLEALAEREPQAPKFIMPGWLPCGYASLFAGHGGVGKSGLALHMAVCMAAEIPFFGLEVERRRVLYLSCEDRENVLHWRLARICAYTGVDLGSLRGRLEVLDLVGRDCVLWEHDPRTWLTLTRAYVELKTRVEQYGTEVLMLDGVSDTYAGNENSRPDVKRFVNAGLALIPADNGAELLISHVAKPTASGLGTSEGYSGSTAWHNSVRARWYLYPETEIGEDDQGRAQRTGNLIFELQKSNFGPIDQSMRFGWDDEAKMFLAQKTITTRPDRNHRDSEERDGILRSIQGCATAGITIPAAHTGNRTALHVLRERPEFPEILRRKSERSRFWRHIEYLRQFGAVSEHEHRRKNRHPTTVLVATGKACADAPNARD